MLRTINAQDNKCTRQEIFKTINTQDNNYTINTQDRNVLRTVTTQNNTQDNNYSRQRHYKKARNIQDNNYTDSNYTGQ